MVQRQLSSDLLNAAPGFFFCKAAEFGYAAPTQCCLFHGQRVIFAHYENEIIFGFCQGKDLIILPL